MTSTPLTLAVDGEVALDAFAGTVVHFCGLVSALTKEVGSSTEVRWLVEDAVGGGTQVTVWAEASRDEAVAPVASAFLAVGQALAKGRSVPYSPQVAKEARALAGILEGGVRSLRFETADDDVVVLGPTERRTDLTFGLPLVGAYGSVEGRVVAISGCCPIRFMLLDRLDRGLVAGYLRDDQRELLRGAWDRRVIADGWLIEDGVTGRPLTVRRITSVEILEDVPPGSLLVKARGILPAMPGDPLPEETIRQLRDAWDE